MSFTTDITKELLSVPVKKTCCKKAILLGILCGARDDVQGGGYVSYFYEKDVATLAYELLCRIFHAQAELFNTVRAGRDTYVLRFCSSGVDEFFKSIEKEPDIMPHVARGFRCAACQTAFLRGVFLGCGTVNDPTRGYHLEMSFPTKARGELIARAISDTVGSPNRIQRGQRYSIYYKKNGAITDFLCYIGCSHTSFDMANVCIERDIRNNENRATNCVTSNISRSVDATRKQIDAINLLIKKQRLSALGEELEYTARLRLAHDSATLSELALLHQPPITKSGLNGRLRRILEAASELDKA